ncbi:MAG: 50S ribosomal protein L11 methyltransferase [Thermodesulforhabdaceae bacterium]
MTKQTVYKLQVRIDSNVDESLMDEFTSMIAMNLQRPVLQLSSNILELSASTEEQQFIISSISNLANSFLSQPIKVTIESYDDSDWESEWKKHIKPIEVGKKFLICPSWEFPPHNDQNRLVITIDPGMAFGTGHHETTRLCLEWIDRFALANREILSRISLLDVGTGSGILAIASALVGFGSITAIDNDPEAISVARENALKNNVYEKINFFVGEPSEINGAFDVVIANIQSNVLIEMAPLLTRKTVMRLVLSGILKEQEKSVRVAFETKQSFSGVSLSQLGEWVLLDFAYV